MAAVRVNGTLTSMQVSALTFSSPPATPVNGQAWITRSGTAPARAIKLNVQDGGSTRVVAEVDY